MRSEPNILDRFKNAYEYRHEPEQMRVLATMFWNTLLALAAPLIVLFLWLGIAQLVDIMGEGQPARGVGGVLPLNRAQLDAAVGALRERSAATQARMSSPVQVGDPAAAK